MRYLILLLAFANVYADDYVPRETISTINQPGCAASAMAMSAIDMSLAIPALQIGLGGGWCMDKFNNETAGVAAAMGKRMCLSETNCGIGKLTFSAEEEGGKAVSAGFVWVWK